MVNNYWAQQAARQLQKKQRELKSTASVTPIRRNKNNQQTVTKNRRTRYFLSTSQGGCGCGK